jgi:phage tail protein X
MPTNTYITVVNDRLDKIAQQFYGIGPDPTRTINRYVEQLIEANPGLEEYDFLLPANVTVTIPVIANTATAVNTIKRVNLWD